MMWYQNPEYVDDVSGKRRKDQFNDGFKHDMGIAAAWNMGYSGKGVVVSIIDDGIEYTHDDLKKNYDPKASKVRFKIGAHDVSLTYRLVRGRCAYLFTWGHQRAPSGA